MKFQNSQEKLADFDDVVSPYWTPDTAEVIATKITDKHEYDERLRRTFRALSESGDGI